MHGLSYLRGQKVHPNPEKRGLPSFNIGVTREGRLLHITKETLENWDDVTVLIQALYRNATKAFGPNTKEEHDYDTPR